jgi:hypothetical protein
MSQQGPGGYGGGYGPPGAPPGAPPGWSPQAPAQQAYGIPAGAPPGGTPQPPKGTNPLVWVGIGCGVLLLLAIGTGLAAFLMARKAVQRGVEAAGAFSGAVEVALDGGQFSFDGGLATDGGLSTFGGPTCQRAADCCRRVVEKTGASAAALESCERLRTTVPEAGCQKALDLYRVSAPAFGIVCP